MSEDDKEYLRKHNIHKLLDGLAKEIIERRPDNPQQFVVEWLRKKEEEEEAGGQHRRRSTSIKISIPDTPQRAASTLVVEWLRNKEDIVVVDVREGQVGGHIKGSVPIPLQDFVNRVSEYAEKWKDKANVVFCCAESPDEDSIAASTYLPLLSDQGSSSGVYTLVGGLRQWMTDYGHDPDLTVDYDESLWVRGAQHPCILTNGK